jgi:hypothetical protein
MENDMPQVKGGSFFALTLVTLLALASVAEAGVVTYTEILDDSNDFPYLLLDVGRDMGRVRTLGNGDTFVELDDAVIDEENAVSPNFGLTSSDPVTYSHVFMAEPPVGTFQMASLAISAYSVSGGVDPNADPVEQLIQFVFGLGPIPDDAVIAEGIFLGALTPGGPIVETTFETNTGNEAAIALALQDDLLDVTIIPNGPGILGIPDQVAVRTSEFSVTYLAPAPGTFSLLLLGFPLLVASHRRRSSATSGA